MDAITIIVTSFMTAFFGLLGVIVRSQFKLMDKFNSLNFFDEINSLKKKIESIEESIERRFEAIERKLGITPPPSE